MVYQSSHSLEMLPSKGLRNENGGPFQPGQSLCELWQVAGREELFHGRRSEVVRSPRWFGSFSQIPWEMGNRFMEDVRLFWETTQIQVFGGSIVLERKEVVRTSQQCLAQILKIITTGDHFYKDFSRVAWHKLYSIRDLEGTAGMAMPQPSSQNPSHRMFVPYIMRGEQIKNLLWVKYPVIPTHTHITVFESTNSFFRASLE